MNTFEYIKKRCSKLEAERQTWEDHWQDILDYVMPRKADVTFVRAKGTKRTFCRKKKNTKKATSVKKTRKRTILTEASKLKGHSKKTQRALAKLR